MSETKYTPGPWSIHRQARTLVWSEARDRSIASAGGHFSTAEPDCGAAENAANAQLIAAAPDLYEALKEAIALITDEFPRSSMAVGNWPTVKPVVDRLDAAIAKAEGR